MNYFGVNWLAVIVAMVASMALGVAWYMALARPWMAAVGKTREELQPSDPTPYIWSVVVQLVMAYFVALLDAAAVRVDQCGQRRDLRPPRLARLRHHLDDPQSPLPGRQMEPHR